MKRKLASLAQFAVGAGILAYILFKLHSRGDLHKLALALNTAAGRWPYLVAAFLGFGLCIFLCILRWQVLLEALGIRLPLRRLSALYYIGQFFNAFMFGATGGDVAKAYYVATETHHKRTEVVATVFIDRIVGLFALMVLTIAIMLARLRFFLATPEMRAAFVFSAVMVVGSLSGLALMFRRNLAERLPLFRWIEQRTPIREILTRAHNAFRLCMRSRSVLIKTGILSLLNHVGSLVAIFYLGLALRIDLGFVDYLTVFPAINAIAAMPITPSGLGTRESACLFLLGPLGVSPSAAVTLSLLYYGTLMAWSLVGGLVYLFYTLRRGLTPPPAPEA